MTTTSRSSASGRWFDRWVGVVSNVAIDRLALAVILFASLVVATVWVIRVPLFQSPDENAHADYAFTLFTTWRPVPIAGRIPGSDVHPLVRYLEQKSNFRGMRHNLDGRVPTGYGSPAFFVDLDAGAPRVSRDFLSKRGARIPYVARAYSYLYYAMDAVAIAIGARLSDGSATIEFLSARLLGVVLLGGTLLLSYATLRELRLGARRALMLTATIGLFPLTSWVSAYVQPDNLSFFAVALALYVAVRLKGEVRDIGGALGIGLALSLLALTKQQYFLALALPISASLALGFLRTRPSVKQLCKVLGAVVGLPLLAGLSAEAFITGASHQVAGFLSASDNPFVEASRRGAWPLLVYVVTSVPKAWSSFFYNGFTFFGFWGEFSWERSLISFGPSAVTSTVFSLLAGCSFIVGALMLVRFALRVLPGLYRVARGRGMASALRLSLSNLPLASYFTFIAIMLGINVTTDGALAGEGRYWLPFILPMLLCATVYAPQVLPRRLRLPFANSMAFAALAYSVIATIAAQASVYQRFYGPVVHAQADEPWAIVRSMKSLDRRTLESGEIRSFPHDTVISIEGVAIDSRSDAPATSVDVLVDGIPRSRARLGIAEPQIIANLHDDALLNTGFAASLDLHGLSRGWHEISLAVGEASRKQPYPSRARIRIEIE